MTTLTITPDVAKKKLKLAGTVASGEKVAVTVAGFGTVSTTNLRLRVMAGDVPVGYFPLEDEDEWTVSGSDLTCTLDLATWQAERHCKLGAEVCFILEDTGTPQLYGVGDFSLRPWIKLTGVDVPKNLDNYKVQMMTVFSEIDRVEALADGKYEKPSGGIPSSDMSQAVQTSLAKADTVTMKVSKSAFDSLLGLSLPDTATQKDTRIIVQRILGVLQSAATCIALMFALPSFGIDTTTAWEDVPPQTPVKSVVEQFSPSGGLTTNDVCNIVTNEVFTEWTVQWDEGFVAIVSNIVFYVDPDWWQIIGYDEYGNEYPTTAPGGPDAVELINDNCSAWRKASNALGLARLADLPSTNGLATSSQVASATNVIATQMAEYAQNTYAASKAYADAKEYSNYYIVTNSAIDGSGTTVTNDMGELITGMAFDLYLTNSLYFIDSYEIPTFKFFAPHRRHVYLGNDFSCVEIGDSRQFLKTYNVQVDGAMAIPDPSHIRFMSTLDRNAPYDQGVAMSLQDYLDAFNPVLVPQTIAMYQTNRADFSIGNIMVHGEIGAAYAEENNYRSNPLLFHVSETNFNYGDVFSVKPHFDNAVEELTNSYGQVTNHYSYVQANANIRTVGLWDLRGDMAVSELSIKDKLYVPGFDDIVMAGFYASWDTNGKIKIEKGVPDYMNMAGPCTSFRQATIRDYMDTIVEPFVAATNIYQQGGVVKEVHSLKPVENATGSGITSQPEGVALQGDNNNRELLLRTNNRTTYHYNGSAVDSSNFNASSAETVSNLVVRFSHPYGYTNESSHLEVRLVVDMSTCAHMLNINIGRENFSSFGNGIWDTILSTTEPDIRTEQIVHTETSVWYDWIYDETIGDWVEDTENPHETTEEWYDEYQTDMTFVVEPYACKEFYFKQVGDKTVRVEIMPLYKTNPTSN